MVTIIVIIVTVITYSHCSYYCHYHYYHYWSLLYLILYIYLLCFLHIEIFSVRGLSELCQASPGQFEWSPWRLSCPRARRKWSLAICIATKHLCCPSHWDRSHRSLEKIRLNGPFCPVPTQLLDHYLQPTQSIHLQQLQLPILTASARFSIERKYCRSLPKARNPMPCKTSIAKLRAQILTFSWLTNKIGHNQNRK